jgi:hypothetical protein
MIPKPPTPPNPGLNTSVQGKIGVIALLVLIIIFYRSNRGE